jgi:hypothetical protein
MQNATTTQIREYLKTRNDDMSKYLHHAITPQFIEQAIKEENEVRDFIGTQMKKQPPQTPLERAITKLSMKRKMGVPLNAADHKLLKAIHKQKFPNAKYFQHLVPNHATNYEARRKQLDELIQSAHFQKTDTSRKLLENCNFISLQTILLKFFD